MLIFLLVASGLAAPALKNDALVLFEAALGGPEALERHKAMLRSVFGDPEVVDEPIKSSMAASNELTGRRLTEAEINEPIAEFLYQGDILLTEADVARMTATRSKRGAPNVSSKRFNKNQPIGFVFDSSIPESSRKTIRETTSTIAANTCLSFKENAGKGTQFNFFRGGGCYTAVGENADSNGLHWISYNQGCESNPAQITHEIFHALGLGHTVSRYDRDLYVTVHKDRIQAGKEHNFDQYTKEQNNNFGVPYDYGSMMHYGATSYATVDGQIVIEPKSEYYYEVMGQRSEVTYNDYRLINMLYNCSSHCPKQMACQNGGYPSPKDCNACVCPEFFTGANCQTAKNLISLTASTPTGQTTFHQEFDQKTIGSYKRELYGKDGPKVIRVPEGRKIRVTFSRMSIQQGRIKKGFCGLIDIEIRDTAGGELTTLGKHFCDPSKLEGFSFVSQSNVIGYKASTSPGFDVDIEVKYSLV